MAQPDNKPAWAGTSGPKFIERETHRHWLLNQANSLFEFFQHNAFNPAGGFFALDNSGQPLAAKPGHGGPERQLHETTRMIHCFAIADLLGLPGAGRNVDHGMQFLWQRHRDHKNSGYFWGVNDDGPTDPSKQAYGHAFVLLAASSAKIVGHPDADRLLADISEILQTRFWEAQFGATSEEYGVEWQPLGDYHGQNSNMHLCEALMAAFEATGGKNYLLMAQSIAELIINRHAREQNWRVAEHFDSQWQLDRSYDGDPMFRPRGTTPGHALEWSRLLVQLFHLGGRKHDWMPEAAKKLFFKTVDIGWSARTGGFYYTLDWDNRPDQSDRFWWPCAEGIGAAAMLSSLENDPMFEQWYRRIWGVVANHFIDHNNGGWFPELNDEMKPVSLVFVGKPDLYHSVQACLIPLLDANGSITRGLQNGGVISLLSAE